MTATRQNAVELINRGGIIKASLWVSGKGSFSKRRAIPELCSRYERDSRDMTAEVKVFFEKNPKIKACIAFIGSQAQKDELLAEFAEMKA